MYNNSNLHVVHAFLLRRRRRRRRLLLLGSEKTKCQAMCFDCLG